MVNKSEKEKKEYPKRKPARLKFDVGESSVEIPIEVSCRTDGECVLRHPRMEDIIFPKKEKEITDKKSLMKKFREGLLRRNKKKTYMKKTGLFAKNSPGVCSRISTTAGISGVNYTYEIRKKFARVKLDIDTKDKEWNKRFFESLQKKKSEIENNFGKKLKWEYKKDKRVSNIAFSINGGLSNEKGWESLQNRMVDKMIKLHGALDKHIQALKQ